MKISKACINIIRKLLATICMLFLLCSCTNKVNEQSITSIDDINGSTVGCMSGSIYDKLIKDNFEDAKIIYYNSRSELLLALKSGKISSFIADEPVGMLMCNESPEISYLDQNIGTVDFGICFSESNTNLRNQFNEYLNTIREKWPFKRITRKMDFPKLLRTEERKNRVNW